MLAKIAVSAGVFSIDKPYSYKIPASMQALPGMRAVVPFGKGNKRVEGVIVATEQGDETGLKTIDRLLDDAPVLSKEQLQLASFMHERYFCTFYDAVRAILPAALWFQTTEILALSPSAGDWQEAKFPKELHQLILQAIEDFGGSAPLPVLRKQFPEEDGLDEAIAWLKKKGLLQDDVDRTAKAGKKTERVAVLAVSTEQAQLYASRKQHSAPLQKAVLELLSSVGSGSCKEICYLTGASMATLRRLEQVGLLTMHEREVYRTPLPKFCENAEKPTLNPEQQAAFDGILLQMKQLQPGAALLYGVTGSGKTEVYISLIYEALSMGKTAMLLVPEIALTPQLLGKLAAHFGKKVAVLHSALKMGERFDEWRRIANGEAQVVVGTRSAVFAPLQNPGILILDEEQEHTYKSENAPRYHAREIALYRGYKAGALVLLGSATPSVESMYHAKRGDYALYRLSHRYNGKNLPQVQIIDLKQEIKNGNSTSVSGFLEEAIRDRILEKKQSILFLNRRGNSRSLVCVDCGAAPTCPRCSVHLTYHSANGRLMCHYCGYSEPVKERCPVCGGALKPIGSGTQKVEQELNYFFPDSEVLRVDADTVSAAGGHEVLFDKFRKKNIPIMLGTQMVAKGLDFENVTLVGVLDADMSLYVDNYRAAETTFSLLTQVVGRAGRGNCDGQAVIQTMTPEHPVIRLASEQNYDAFYEMEIQLRQLRGFPPFSSLYTVTLTGLFEQQVIQAACRFRDGLRGNLSRKPFDTQKTLVLGPAPAPVAKVNYAYRYRLTLGCKNSKEIRALLAYLLDAFSKDRQNRGVSAYIDLNIYD